MQSEDPRVHKHLPPHDTSGGSRPSSFFSRDDALQQVRRGRGSQTRLPSTRPGAKGLQMCKNDATPLLTTFLVIFH